MPEDAAVARSTQAAAAPVGLVPDLLRLAGLVLAFVAYLALASGLALAVVRVGADLVDGIDPFLATASRPRLPPGRLAAREVAVDCLRQVFLALLVVGTVVWRDRGRWRETLAIDRHRPNGLKARWLLLILLLWPAFHITWVTGTAEAFGATFGQGTHLSPFLSTGAIAAWLTYAVVLAPAAEEILIRGETFARARAFLSPVPTILVTALMFAAAHVSTWGLARPTSLLPLALMLGWLRWRSGRLWPCIALHGWSNLVLISYLLWPGTA